MAVFKQTNTHLAPKLSEETLPRMKSVYSTSDICLVSFCKAYCCLLRIVVALTDLETLLFKRVLPLQTESHCQSHLPDTQPSTGCKNRPQSARAMGPFQIH